MRTTSTNCYLARTFVIWGGQKPILPRVAAKPVRRHRNRAAVGQSLWDTTQQGRGPADVGGSGLILGATTIQGGGTLAPATASIGTLTISNALTLSANRTNIFRLNAATPTNDAVAGLNTVTYGGTLIVTNINGTLAAKAERPGHESPPLPAHFLSWAGANGHPAFA